MRLRQRAIRQINPIVRRLSISFFLSLREWSERQWWRGTRWACRRRRVGPFSGIPCSTDPFSSLGEINAYSLIAQVQTQYRPIRYILRRIIPSDSLWLWDLIWVTGSEIGCIRGKGDFSRSAFVCAHIIIWFAVCIRRSIYSWSREATSIENDGMKNWLLKVFQRSRKKEFQFLITWSAYFFAEFIFC